MLKPATPQKRVMVIGGGLAGMSAASILADRGHKVTLYERSDKLGGQWNIASQQPNKEAFSTVVSDIERKLNKAGVNVVFKKKGPSVLKFYANWCGGCQASHEHFLALADKGYCVWAVDVDILSDLSNDLLIQAIPTVFFVDSKGNLHPYQDSFEINKLEESFEAFMLAELIED